MFVVIGRRGGGKGVEKGGRERKAAGDAPKRRGGGGGKKRYDFCMELREREMMSSHTLSPHLFFFFFFLEILPAVQFLLLGKCRADSSSRGGSSRLPR